MDSPRDMSVMVFNGSVHLSWLPPCILEGVKIESYWVNVSVYTASDTNGTSHSIEGNVQDWSLHEVDNSGCTVYSICVQAVTAAGLGEAACVSKSSSGGVTGMILLCVHA